MKINLSKRELLEGGSEVRKTLYDVVGGGGPDSRATANFIEDLAKLNPRASPEIDPNFVPDDEEGYVLDEWGEGSTPSVRSWASVESNEDLKEILRSNSRGLVAENYHHDHLFHQKWPSTSRPPPRTESCMICPKRKYQERPRMVMVEAFAKEGCFYCEMIRKIITYHAPNPPISKYIDWAGWDWHSFGIPCDSHARDHPQFGDCTCGVEIFVPQDDENEYQDLSAASLVSGDTGSEEAFIKASNWLKQCVKNHKRCASSEEVPLPRRVLDLGMPGSEDKLKLYEPENETGRYIALSHCWGNSQYPAKTTSLTLNRNKRNIPWNSFPKTFQDAIKFARWLKIRFLWIDSLCIIQDSKEDWEEEAPKMIDIYQRSFLTIAATGSPSDDEGCSSTTSPESRAERLQGQSFDGKPYDFYFRTPLRHPTLGSDVDTGKGELLEAPLLGRSWCYQEILLSPRVLHFFKDELVWECMEDVFCECAGLTSPLSPSRPNLPDSLSIDVSELPPKIYHSLSLEGDEVELQSRWRSIVVEYSGLGLSFAKDKFPALSGLAKQMQLRRPDESYAAGLWTGSLLEDLLWRVDKAEAEDPDLPHKKLSWRPNQWRAPTWSWASVDHEVEFMNPRGSSTQKYLRVMQVNCLPATDPTSELIYAELLLSGRLIPATWWERIIYRPENSRSLHLKLADSGVISWRNRLDDFRYPVDSRDSPYYGWPLNIWTEPYGEDVQDEPSSIMSDIEIFCLPVIECDGDEGLEDVYLILRPVLSGSNEYQRIGIASIDRRQDEVFPFFDVPETKFTLI